MTTATRAPFTDAAPATIRAALLDEERPQFDREYQHALDVAAEDLTLDELHATLTSWRRIAALAQADPDAHRRMLTRAEHTLRTGQRPENTVPAEDVKELIRQRLGS